MKTLDELKEFIVEMTGDEEVVVFDNPSYVTAVVGISHDNRVIYSYDKMIDYLVKTDEMTDEEAIEFIDYNTLRAIPYAGENAPIILMDEEQTKFFYEDD